MNKTPASNKPGLRRRLGKAVGHLLSHGNQKRVDTVQVKPQPKSPVQDGNTTTDLPQRTAPVAPVRTAEQSFRNLMARRESEELPTIDSIKANTSVARVVRPHRTGTLVYENPATFSSGSLPRGIYGAAPPVPGSERYSGQRRRQNSTAQYSQYSRPPTLSRSRQNSQLSGKHTPSGSSGYSSIHIRQNSDGSAFLGHGIDDSQWRLYSNPATYSSAASLPQPVFGAAPSVAGPRHSSAARGGQNLAGQHGRSSTASHPRQNSQLSGSGSSGYGSMPSSMMHTRQNSDGGRDNTAPSHRYDNRGIYRSAPLSPVSEHSAILWGAENSAGQGISPLTAEI